jgi:hypothetical protein
MCYGLLGTADERHSERALLCQRALGLALGWTLVQIAGAFKKATRCSHGCGGVFEFAFPYHKHLPFVVLQVNRCHACSDAEEQFFSAFRILLHPRITKE